MSPRAGLDPGRVADAAVAIADRDGLDGVTIARVAAELGVKGPSLYNHVASRDALVRAVALRGITELTDALTLAATGLAGEDAVLAAGRAYRDYAGAAPGRYTAGLRAPASGDEDLRAAAARALGAFHATLRGYALSEEELVHAVRAMRSALHGFVTLEAEGGFAMDVDRDRSFEAMLQMLVAGIGARVGLGG